MFVEHEEMSCIVFIFANRHVNKRMQIEGMLRYSKYLFLDITRGGYGKRTVTRTVCHKLFTSNYKPTYLSMYLDLSDR